MLCCCLYCSLCLNIVCRTHYYHAWDRAHQRNILVTLMGSSILSYRNSCMGSADLNIQMRISYGIPDLFKGSSCSKHGKAAHKWDLTGGCHTGSNANHITFCNTAVDMSVGICFLKNTCFGSSSKICIQNDYIRIFCSQFYQSVSVTFPGRDLFHCIICHYASSFNSSSSIFSRSAIATAYCSSFGAVPCQLTLFSIKETPFPFTLCAMIAVGMPLVCLAS